MRRRWSSKLAVALVALYACSPHSVDPAPKAPVRVPETFGPDARQGELADRFWRALGSAELDTLVERALAGNLQLHAAWARIAQAEALAAQSGAARFPQINLGIDAQRSERYFPPLGTVTQKSYSLSLPVSYEVDLWNKYGSSVDAATANVRASRDDLEAAAISIASEVTEAWLDLVHTRAVRLLLEAQLEGNRELLALVEQRFAQGLAAKFETYQQQQQVLAVEAQLELLDAQRASAGARLSVLLGLSRGDVTLGELDRLPELTDDLASGVPADLLERRPDLRAARERVVAADHQLASAVSSRLPSLVLTGSVGFSASHVKDLFDALLNSLGASLNVPVLDGGARAAEARRVRAQRHELLASYGELLLRAISEVETALSLETHQVRAIAILSEQKKTAELSLTEARERYAAGLTDYLPVLTAAVASQTAARSVLDAARTRLSYRVQLCRALGGSWTVALRRPNAPG